MNIQVKHEDGMSPRLVRLVEDEYYAIPVDSGDDEEPPIHTDAHPRCEDETCPCQAEQQKV